MEIPSKKIKNIIGQKFNMLTVLEFDCVNHNGASVWKCQCDCGNIVLVTGNHLTRGQTKSCGCLAAIKSYKDGFINKGLIPLEEIPDGKTNIHCIDKEGYQYKISYGTTQDKRTKHFDKWSKNNPYKVDNMKLFASTVQENCVILSSDEELRNATSKRIRFLCPECGKEFTKKWCHWIAMPINRHVCPKCNESSVSAGISQYNRMTDEWLNNHNINFIREVTFPDLKDKSLLRFDYCADYKNKLYYIEVDGPQHDSPFGFTTEEDFALVKKHDKMKNDYCKNKGLILVRLNWKTFKTNEYQNILNKTFFG